MSDAADRNALTGSASQLEFAVRELRASEPRRDSLATVELVLSDHLGRDLSLGVRQSIAAALSGLRAAVEALDGGGFFDFSGDVREELPALVANVAAIAEAMRSKANASDPGAQVEPGPIDTAAERIRRSTSAVVEDRERVDGVLDDVLLGGAELGEVGSKVAGFVRDSVNAIAALGPFGVALAGLAAVAAGVGLYFVARR